MMKFLIDPSRGPFCAYSWVSLYLTYFLINVFGPQIFLEEFFLQKRLNIFPPAFDLLGPKFAHSGHNL